MIVALVVGGSHGAGLEICGELADRDLEVILTGPDEQAAHTAAETLWDQGLDSVHPRVLDADSDADAVRLAGLVTHEFGRLDVLVHAEGDAEHVTAAFAELLEQSSGRVIDATDGDVAAAVRQATS